jgi:primosomal protein N' (replication factor Y)
MIKSIAQVVVGLPLEGPFDYSVDENLLSEIAVGKRVYISFNRRKRVGYVIGLIEKSAFEHLNPILSILDEVPSLDVKALSLTRQFSEYYGCSWGEAIEAYLPAFLRKSKYIVERENEIQINFDGVKASTQMLCELDEQKKWDTLCNEIKNTLASDRGVIFLAPEVSQAKRLFNKLEELADSSVIIDKKVSVKKEKENWEKIRRGETRLVVGTRSAIFAPVKRLGLIVISHEGDSSYKQEQSPHYHVNKVAELRSQIEGCKVLLEGAAPSVETWFCCQGSRIIPAGERGKNADVQVIDLSNYDGQKGSLLSPPLQNEIRGSLEKNQKMLLLMNRKGFSTMTACNECGFSLKCPHCSVNLTYMSSAKVLVCTHCTFKEVLPNVCPQCNHAYLRSVGVGIERMASTVGKFFPEAKVAVFDKDTKKVPRSADIVIATQAIFKWGEDAKFSSAVFLDFDAELNRFNFRSSQEAYTKLIRLQLLAKEKAFVQTRNPDNVCIQAVQKGKAEIFYDQELLYRKDLELPPYKHMAEIIVRGVKEESVCQYSQELFALLEKNKAEGVIIMNPHPDSMPKLRDQYRYNIMLKSESPVKMLEDIKSSVKNIKRRNIIVTINIDP